jgi:hypothetical protein
MINPISNGFFTDWAWNSSAPSGWSVSAATTTKETSINETFSWSVKCVGTGSGTGSFFRDFDDYLQQRSSGSGITFMARIYTPSSNGTTNAGRLNVITSEGSELLSPYAEVSDGWTWRMIYVEPELLDSATSLRLSIFTGNTTDIIYIDRVMLIEGRTPGEPAFKVETLSEYYDPLNVGTKASNSVTVTNNTVVMDSTSESFPSFFINVFGLVPNEQFTMTWTYAGSGSGTMLARSALNDSGDTLETVTPLSTGSISWTPTLSTGSLQISNSLGTEPFTLSNITITKG